MNRKYLQLIEKVFAIIGLTFFTGGFGVGSPPLLPAFLTSTIRYGVWFVSLIVIVLNYKKALAMASQDIFICILVPIVYASSIWSLNPEFTDEYMGQVLRMSSFALYLATRFSIKQQVRLVAWTFAIGAIVSILVVWRLPGVGLHWKYHLGAWKGIYDYKNTFGSMMIIGSIAFLLMPVDSLKHQRYKWGFFYLMLLLIYFSTSKTSLIVSFLVLFILYLYRKFRWQGKRSVFFLDLGIMIFGGISGLVVALWVEILGAFGKDGSLTGRVPMWTSAISRVITEQPLLGFGRGGFWADESNYAIEAGMTIGPNYVPPHAHNGYIDLALDVGLVGLSLFLISLTIAFFRSFKLAYNTDKSEYVWPLGFLLFLSLNNMSESYLLRLANVYWVLYVSTALSVGREIRSLTLKRSFRGNNS
ncbi:MAG: O-antigen ligase family protein [Cyanobacteria bacterium P01_D01_bin.50]